MGAVRVLSIERFATGDEGTQSNVRLEAACWAGLELPWRADKADISCIPAGTYEAQLLRSDRFDRMLYHVLGVPGRSAIEIHSGNFAGDEARGFKTDVEGCILLGHSFGHLVGCSQLALIASRMGLSEFMAVAAGEPLTVVVTWACANPEVAT